MVGAVKENNRTTARSGQLNLSQNILGIRATVGRTSRQRRHSCITRSHALSLWREGTVGRAGANDNPVTVVAIFSREIEGSGKRCTCLEFDRIAAVRIVQGSLQIAAAVDKNISSRRGCVGHAAGHACARQFSRAIRISTSRDVHGEVFLRP